MSCMSFFIHYRSAYSQYTTTLSVTSSDIVSLEHIVLTLTLTLEDYGTEYDYDDLYDYIYDYYYGRSEDNVAFKDFEYLEEVAKGNTDRDIYDWLGDSHPKRGDIKVELESPSGTKSTLLPYRKYDFINAEGYDNWPFMSLHYWGENPIGTWTINVYFKSSSGYVSVHVNSFEFYGTNVIPEAVTHNSASSSTNNYPTVSSSTNGKLTTTTTTSYTPTATTSDSENGDLLQNMSFVLPVVIGGVIFLVIFIAAVVSVLVCVTVRIKRQKQTTQRYQMMPVGSNE